jgi:hypothetical protein
MECMKLGRLCECFADVLSIHVFCAVWPSHARLHTHMARYHVLLYPLRWIYISIQTDMATHNFSHQRSMNTHDHDISRVHSRSTVDVTQATYDSNKKMAHSGTLFGLAFFCQCPPQLHCKSSAKGNGLIFDAHEQGSLVCLVRGQQKLTT